MSPMKIKFVSRKISRIRWLPKSTSMFVTGSYDDDENNICMWKFPDQTQMNDGTDDCLKDDEPNVISKEKFTGSVTDLEVLSEDLIFASSSVGSLCIFKYAEEKVQCTHTWENVHHFKRGTAAATGIAVKGQDISSVGEDGRLCIFNFIVNKKVREIESSNLCSLTCVSYLRHQEVVAGNSLGYLRLWDLRSCSDSPGRLLMISREQTGVSSMNVHPTQSHILATGHEDGSLCIWDMRQEKRPMSLLEGHSAAITDLLFHPVNPDFLYTCSLDGTVWQWDSSQLRSSTSGFTPSLDSQDQNVMKGNPWLLCDDNKHKLEITSLCSQSMCVNSLDLSGSILIWGSDNEALYILNDIAV
ncbi:Nucleoporin Nup43, partial [Stegodyphus mimosarum]